MASLDVRTKGVRFLPFKISRLVKKAKKLPNILIVNKKQLNRLTDSLNIEILLGSDKWPTEYLYRTKWNIMEVKIKELHK